jgi:sigma-B regulation protein RsbU (phosphoserine phosphatase)
MPENIKQTKTELPGSAAELQLELGIKKAQLKWLLQITRAINNNFSNQDLLKIFEDVLKDECRLRHYALFYFQHHWKLLLLQPADEKIKSMADELLLHLNTSGSIESESFPEWRGQFDLRTPIIHEKHKLAYLFTSDTDRNGRKLPSELIKFVETITNLVVVAMENNNFKLMREEQIAMKKEREMAAQIQMLLIPDILPQHVNMQCEKLYIPHTEVGGDYLDLIQTGEHEFIFCIGDAMGKGMPAAMLMSNFQANLQALLQQKLSLTAVIESLNCSIFRFTRGERYITFFIGRIDLNKREIHYINAGHPPPVMVHRNSSVMLDSGSTFLGTFEKLPELRTGVQPIPSPGLLMCYTDGITDVRNESGEQFGIEGVKEFLNSEMQGKTVSEIHSSLLSRIDAYSKAEPRNDDITLLSLRFN